MPNGQSHRIGAADPVPQAVSGILSEEQFDQLVALLDAQHQALVELLAPIQQLAAKLLAVEPSPNDPKPAEPDRADTGSGNYQTDPA